MTTTKRRRFGRAVSALAFAVSGALLGLSAPPAAAADGGPAFVAPLATLDAALTCPGNLAGAAKTPVLLVHGTSSTPQESWSWGYQRALTRAGYPVCTVTLPDRAGANLEVSAEYVVRAIRTMNATSGRKVSTIGHSQGALYPLWAARFWPDVAGKLDDVISLAGPLAGSAQASARCLVDCAGIAWQMSIGSDAIEALRRAPLPAGPSYSSIATLQDELALPQPTTARMPGVTTRWVQDVCPLRVVGHAGMLWDRVGYDLALDALTHAGPADAARVSRWGCADVAFDDADMLASVALLGTVPHLGLDYLFAPSVSSEPALPAYARAG